MNRYRWYQVLDFVSTVLVFIITDYIVENNLFNSKLYLLLYNIAWAYFGWSCYWMFDMYRKYKSPKKKAKQKQ